MEEKRRGWVEGELIPSTCGCTVSREVKERSCARAAVEAGRQDSQEGRESEDELWPVLLGTGGAGSSPSLPVHVCVGWGARSKHRPRVSVALLWGVNKGDKAITPAHSAPQLPSPVGPSLWHQMDRSEDLRKRYPTTKDTKNEPQ